MSPSLIKSGVGRVEEVTGEFPRDGRDLNGARSMRALPWGTMESYFALARRGGSPTRGCVLRR